MVTLFHPGDAYPVFQTDFGRVGLMICWDVQFPEPARALALDPKVETSFW